VIAAIGDSITHGYGLAQTDGLVPQLQQWLDAADVDVDLRNAGVSGDTTAGGLARVDWTLTPDVDGLIVALGGNDYLRGFDPAQTRANLQGILEKAAAQNVPVLLVGLEVGTNFGPAHKAAFEAIYPTLAATFDVALYPDLSKGIKAAAQNGDLLPFLQGDGIHPNAEGVALIVADFGPQVAAFAESLGD